MLTLLTLLGLAPALWMLAVYVRLRRRTLMAPDRRMWPLAAVAAGLPFVPWLAFPALALTFLISRPLMPARIHNGIFAGLTLAAVVTALLTLAN
ncbi:MAG: hypothetical protein ACM33T_05235 [Solirubrobacterales bacterium]